LARHEIVLTQTDILHLHRSMIPARLSYIFPALEVSDTAKTLISACDADP